MPNNEWGDFQTPNKLVDLVYKCVPSRNWKRILEPTCGIGNFMKAGSVSFPDAEIIGIEVNETHADPLIRDGFSIVLGNIFDLDLARDLSWKSDGDLLVVGNPPWVTNAQLGKFGSLNLPKKENLKNLSGFDAMTGESNFDIAEFILLKVMTELSEEKPTVAFLVKTQVARNVLIHAAQFDLPYTNFQMRPIDAKVWFNASVDACLLSFDYSDAPKYSCDIYPDIECKTPSQRMAIIDGRIVADVDAYMSSSFADGVSPIQWRSGVKHDAAKVMELSVEESSKLGLEKTHVFPLMKCTDVFRERREPKKVVVIPQLEFGEDTAHLKSDAPVLWSYLQSHSTVLDARGSSIYRGQPRFAIFGLGPYTFAPYKIAISGLHKEVRFVLLAPIEGRPVILDDACYMTGFENAEAAAYCHALLTSEIATSILQSLIFWDAKRPVNKKLLQRIDLAAIARHSDRDQIEASANKSLQRLGFKCLSSWEEHRKKTMSEWEQSAAGKASHRRVA